MKVVRFLAVVAALAAAAAPAQAAHVAGGHLLEVGPVSPSHAFPDWYRDARGIRFEPCLDGANPLCGFLPGDIPDPNAPIAFPGNFPEEVFYWMATAQVPTNGGGLAVLVLALEGAFGGGPVAPGDQVVFGRVRLRLDNLEAGATYTVTHPFGTDTFTNVAGGLNGVNATEDIGIGAPGDFTGALDSRIGVFLEWDPAVAPAAPAGFAGDPAVDHPVVGSPFGTNVFRIEGPNVGGPGVNVVETNLFSVMGRRATRAGVAVPRATYARPAADVASIDVFARTEAGQSLLVQGTNVPSTALVGNAQGRYFAHLVLGAVPPLTLTVTNTTDAPDTVLTVPLVDQVTVTRAAFDAVAGVLTVDAQSSDAVTNPALELAGFGPFVAGSIAAAVDVPPEAVTVTSAAGGRTTVPVAILSPGFAPEPVVAHAGPDQTAQQGSSVTLDAAGSTGTITSFLWTQIGGTPVTLAGADTVVATFVAPPVAGQLTFSLTVQGSGGPSTDTVVITVPSVAPPVANAGPDQAVRLGTTVQLDGSASTGAASFAWTQLSGPAVTLSGATLSRPTFVFPNAPATLVFQLTVSGPGGTATDTVQVTNVSDTLGVTTASFRTGSREWRVEGTATIAGPGNTVTIRLGPTLDGPIVGTAQVDALGVWSFRVKNASVVAGTGDVVSLQSSAGGVLLAVPVQVRR